MRTFVVRESDADVRCSVCRFLIAKGDDARDSGTGEPWMHERCASGVEDGHMILWENAESVMRTDWQQREEQRIAPLSKQGACPTCFIELPVSGICDDHGRPA